MPKLEYFLICESISTDQETNRISLFNVLEDIRLLPSATDLNRNVLITQSVAVACWNRESGDEDEEFQAVIRIHPPGENPHDLRLNFKMERPRQRLLFRLLGMPKLNPGELRFELRLNDVHVAWHTVNVSPRSSDSEITANSSAD